jgi:polyribonucleotide nucleotidyltransferase
MLGNYEKKTRVGEMEMSLLTGYMAKQANGAVFLRYGENVIFAAATMDSPREGMDFFPLMVDYRERTAAAGRFPGGYFKREGRPTDREILIARMIDRPIRPLFPDGFRNDVQLQLMLFSSDRENETDVFAINAASAALCVSDIPFDGPLGAVRIGRIDGEFIVNPTHAQIEASDLDLIYVGRENGDMMMIEGAAKECPEDDFLAAMDFAQPFVQEIIRAQKELAQEAGKPKIEPVLVLPSQEWIDYIEQHFGEPIKQAIQQTSKQERKDQLDAIKTQVVDQATGDKGDEPVDSAAIGMAFAEVEKKMIRRFVLESGQRLDGRNPQELRPLKSETSILPRTHGSAVFSRGETQTLCITTLGSNSDVQALDALIGGEDEKRFILHYSFPPFSVGECRPIRGPGRREIGHGALAERSLEPVLPPDWPYVVRLNSEIMESNGSTSMASVCGGSLALMDAGIPITKHVAGISIGLITDDQRAVTLTDILGAEDHYGDMDFKVAGTRDGITGFQVDLKIPGLSRDLVKQAVEDARIARQKILDVMEEALPAPRLELSPHAPRIKVIQISPEKIGLLIGPGGKNIRRITTETGCSIDIEDTGEVFIFSATSEGMEQAVREVEALTAEAEVGKIYHGIVKGIKDFGAFVEILPGTEGLVHISEMADTRIRSVEDVCKIGDPMWVKVIEVDDRGKIRLSRREAMAERGERSAPEIPEEAEYDEPSGYADEEEEMERPYRPRPSRPRERDRGPRDRERSPRDRDRDRGPRDRGDRGDRGDRDTRGRERGPRERDDRGGEGGWGGGGGQRSSNRPSYPPRSSGNYPQRSGSGEGYDEGRPPRQGGGPSGPSGPSRRRGSSRRRSSNYRGPDDY